MAEREIMYFTTNMIIFSLEHMYNKSYFSYQLSYGFMHFRASIYRYGSPILVYLTRYASECFVLFVTTMSK